MFVVAGVSGHVGSVVASELLAKGKKIKVLVRDPKKGEAWSKRGAEVAVGELDNEAFLTGALRGATGFFTLLPPNLATADFYGWQRSTAETIARAVKSARVPHVVMLSSVGADLSEHNGPIKGLHHLENALRATGTKLTAIRPGFFQENVALNLDAAKNAGIYPNFFASADDPMPMNATRDIGQLAAESLLSPPAKSEIIDLRGPAYSAREVAEKLGKRLGKKLQIVDIPAAGHVAAYMKAGMPRQLAESYAEMNAGFASGKIRPVGDRLVQAKTTLDEVLAQLLPS